jgi:endonuclease/exonuclease/phosphatase family metal-dependent hydrolase
MRIVTFNLWGTRGPSGRLEILRKALGELDADVLCLQEATDEALLKGLNLPTCLTAPASGLALLSRFPAATHEILTYRAVSSRETSLRQALLANLSLPGGELWAAVTHLSWQAADEPVRLAQVEELLAWTAPRRQRLLLAGDMNAEPSAPPIRQILQSGFVDLWARFHPTESGVTWDNANPFIQSHAVKFPDRRIDYLFLSQEAFPLVKPSACEVVCRAPREGLHPSDHYAVLAHLA